MLMRGRLASQIKSLAGQGRRGLGVGTASMVNAAREAGLIVRHMGGAAHHDHHDDHHHEDRGCDQDTQRAFGEPVRFTE